MIDSFDENTPSIVIDSMAVTLANRDAHSRTERRNAILTYVNRRDLNTLNAGNVAAYGARIH